MARLAQNVPEICIGFRIAWIQRDGFLIGGHRVLRAAGLVRDNAEVEPVDGGRGVSCNRCMKIVQGLGKAVLPVRDEAKEMKRFRMVRGKFERLAVRRFRFNETTGPLVCASLFEPGVDLPSRAVVSPRFLTASLSSIHDVRQPDQRVAEKPSTGQREIRKRAVMFGGA